jgi:hypothetical protein
MGLFLLGFERLVEAWWTSNDFQSTPMNEEIVFEVVV